jgi:protein phosphatase
MGTVFMVADGMGGAAAGEIASATAVDVVLRHLREELDDKRSVSPEEFVSAVNRAAEIANWSIFHYAAGHPELRGMGTTATIAGLLGDRLYLAQVGDSRAYLVRDGVAYQLTKDQSLMQKLIEAGELTAEEAEHSERRNIILQALGPEPSVKLDLTFQQLRRGDVLILCSDGLSGLVKPYEIAAAVEDEVDLSAVADRLIGLANDRGGPDNITVVAARFDGEGLDWPRADDEVRHRIFPLGYDAFGPTVEAPSPAITSVEPEPEPELEVVAAADPAPLAAPAVDSARRKRGQLVMRIIALVGAVVLVLAALRWFKKI